MEGFIGQERNWCVSLLLTSRWPDLHCMSTPDRRGGEEEESNPDFVEVLAVPAIQSMSRAFGLFTDIQ